MNETLDTSAIDQQAANLPGGELLFGPLSILAREKKTWSPALLPGVLWRAATNLKTVFDVRQLLQSPSFAEVARSNPRFAFKYLTHDYLARSFTVAQRACSFLYHYRRVQATSSAHLLRQILSHDITLQDLTESGAPLLLNIGLARLIDCDKEGEFAIKLEVDQEVVYILSFTLVPGEVLRSPAPEVLLISRIQGLPRCYPKVKLATKVLHDVAPAALLLAVAQGIAKGLGIVQIACVSARNQSSYSRQYHEAFISAYDDFFTEIGVPSHGQDFFASPVPIPEKPLSLIKKGHKLRTKEKRAFKQKIMAQCALLFQNESEYAGRAI